MRYLRDEYIDFEFTREDDFIKDIIKNKRIVDDSVKIFRVIINILKKMIL